MSVVAASPSIDTNGFAKDPWKRFGYLFSDHLETSREGAVLCTQATAKGAPLLAIPLSRCWNRDAVKEQCPELYSAMSTALRRNPGSTLLKSDATWIMLHLLYERRRGRAALPSCQAHLELLEQPSRHQQTLMAWQEEDMEVLRGSFWWEEGRRRRRRVAADYRKLCLELGQRVCHSLGISEDGYRWARQVMQQHGISLMLGASKMLVLVPGLELLAVEEQHLPSGAGAQVVLVQDSLTLVFLAEHAYSAGEQVFLSHAGLRGGCGARLAGCGRLLAETVGHNPSECVILPLTLNVDSLPQDTDEFAQMLEELHQGLTRALRSASPLPERGEHCVPPDLLDGESALERLGDLVQIKVCLSQERLLLDSRTLALLGICVLADSAKQSELLMEECAWRGVVEDLACERRGLRYLESEMVAALAKYPTDQRTSTLASDRLCHRVLLAERRLLQHAVDAARARLELLEKGTSESISEEKGALERTRSDENELVLGMVQALEQVASRFLDLQAEAGSDAITLRAELATLLALLRLQGFKAEPKVNLQSEDMQPRHYAELEAMKALLAQMSWEQACLERDDGSRVALTKSLLDSGSLRMQLREWEAALADLTRAVERDPQVPGTRALLQLCEQKLAADSDPPQVVADADYSFDWDDGEEGSVAASSSVKHRVAPSGGLGSTRKTWWALCRKASAPAQRSRSFALPARCRLQRGRPERTTGLLRRKVCLDRTSGTPLGARVRPTARGLLVEEVLGGLIEAWNGAVPEEAALRPGDRIVQVNDVSGEGALLLKECSKKQVLTLHLAPREDQAVASTIPLPSEKVPEHPLTATWQDVALTKLLGFSPPCLCDWQWHASAPITSLQDEGFPSLALHMATVQITGCAWNQEVDDAFVNLLGCKQRIQFDSQTSLKRKETQQSSMLQDASNYDVLILPLDSAGQSDQGSSLTALPLEVLWFLSDIGSIVKHSIRIVALTCGAQGPDCATSHNDGYGLPAAAPVRGIFRCVRIENPGMPILHIDTDSLCLPGKGRELAAQIRSELELSAPRMPGGLAKAADDEAAKALIFTGREVAYRNTTRYLPKLDICGRRPPLEMTSIRAPRVSGEGVALIAGGTGGLGITTAEAMVEAGVRCVVLSSRSGRISATAPGRLLERVEKLRQSVEVVLETCDASEEKQVIAMLDRVRARHGPLRWVVNAAGIVLENLPTLLEAVFVPKCIGAWNMHKHTLQDDLEAMWFFSSLSGGAGSEGLHNYAAANTYIDCLAQFRRAQGLPGVSIQFPEVEEAGMAAAAGIRSGGATVALRVVRQAIKQLMVGDGLPSPVVAIVPTGYLIPRSTFMEVALEPLRARVNNDMWAALEKLEIENKQEVKALRKEVESKREAQRIREEAELGS